MKLFSLKGFFDKFWEEYGDQIYARYVHRMKQKGYGDNRRKSNEDFKKVVYSNIKKIISYIYGMNRFDVLEKLYIRKKLFIFPRLDKMGIGRIKRHNNNQLNKFKKNERQTNHKSSD